MGLRPVSSDENHARRRRPGEYGPRAGVSLRGVPMGPSPTKWMKRRTAANAGRK